jgi:hypothetical protein
MVDRYLLPVPKAKNMKMYTKFRNSKKHSIPVYIAVMTFCFQLNRYWSIRQVNLYK